MVSYIVPIDKNAILNFLLDKRNELTKMINKNERTPENNDFASESDIVETCLVPLVDCILAKITTMPTVPIIGRDSSIGYWIPVEDLKLRCSCCQEDSFCGHSNYCPNCGSLMGDGNDMFSKLY